MTTREFYNAIVSANVSAEITAKANELISALDAKNEKRKANGTKTQKDNVGIKSAIVSGMVKGTVYTAKEIATTNGLSSTQKASALLKQLVESGELVTEEVKTKSGKVIGYKLAENGESADESETAETAETADESAETESE